MIASAPICQAEAVAAQVAVKAEHLTPVEHKTSRSDRCGIKGGVVRRGRSKHTSLSLSFLYALSAASSIFFRAFFVSAFSFFSSAAVFRISRSLRCMLSLCPVPLSWLAFAVTVSASQHLHKSHQYLAFDTQYSVMLLHDALRAQRGPPALHTTATLITCLTQHGFNADPAVHQLIGDLHYPALCRRWDVVELWRKGQRHMQADNSCKSSPTLVWDPSRRERSLAQNEAHQLTCTSVARSFADGFVYSC